MEAFCIVNYDKHHQRCGRRWKRSRRAHTVFEKQNWYTKYSQQVTSKSNLFINRICSMFSSFAFVFCLFRSLSITLSLYFGTLPYVPFLQFIHTNNTLIGTCVCVCLFYFINLLVPSEFWYFIDLSKKFIQFNWQMCLCACVLCCCDNPNGASITTTFQNKAKKRKNLLVALLSIN